jgi:hypothetical protein
MDHHEEVYPSLKVEHMKRVLMEKCPPKNIKGEDPVLEDYGGGMKVFDNASVRPDTFLHDLM